MTMGSLR
ncbi:hypothetical protein LINGRAHAP2_LOCUS6757 [Linum grandiflorum]